MPSKNNFQASCYAAYYALLTKEELTEFLPEGVYAYLGKVVEDPFISRKDIIEEIQAGTISAAGFAYDKKHFDIIEIPMRGKIIKQKLPLIEIKPFAFMITSERKILENTYGIGSVEFGICLSYPSLFSQNGEVIKTRKAFLEAKAFGEMRSFIRKKTKPCKLIIDGKEYRSSFRIGNTAGLLAQKKIESLEGVKIIL